MSSNNENKKKKNPKKSFETLIEPWLEADLTAMAKRGELKPAFEIDDIVKTLAGLIDTHRQPVLVGESGVGKTSIVHELVRQSALGNGAKRLRRTRVLQISLQRRASSLQSNYSVGEELSQLISTLRQSRRKLALFIRDLDFADDYNLEAQLTGLAYAFAGPIIGEASERGMSSMFEYCQSLRQHFTTLRVEEPGYDRTRVMLRMWAQHRGEEGGPQFTAGAVEQAMLLSDRFLARDRRPRKAIEILEQSTGATESCDTITDEMVFDSFCSMHRTPRVLVDPRITLDIDRLREHFVQRIAGQEEAIDVILRMISVIKAGLSDDRRPLGVFLWVGPTGVGKTYLAQLLAEHLFGHRDQMVRLNMADYQGGGDTQTLFGYPTADRQADRAGILTQRLMSMPFGIALLDEFEKAHSEVHDRFLQMFDEGMFINGDNQVISCRSWIIVATSNAGWEHVPGATFGFMGGHTTTRRSRADTVIQKSFRAELLNRFDRVVHFMPLEMDDYRRIAELEINRLGDRVGLSQRRLNLRTEPNVIDWLMQQEHNTDAGARCLRWAIERHVTSVLADLIVAKNPAPGTTIVLTADRDRVIARMDETPVMGCEMRIARRRRHSEPTGGQVASGTREIHPARRMAAKRVSC